MTILKYIFVFASLSIYSLMGLHAQETEFGQNAKHEIESNDQTVEQGFKPSVTVSLGTSFSSFAPGYNTFGTFVAPEISFPVSNRFAVSVGVGYSNIFYNSPGESLFSNTASQYGNVYVSGSYMMTEKLTISGTGYKTFLLNPTSPESELSGNSFNQSNQGVILNLDYKVSERFRINASFQIHQQNGTPYNYMYPNQMGNSSPFNNSGFYPGF
jgi:hypothetical protein